jgi:hypothetical protein
MAESIPMTWGIRKWFWSRWQTLRFSLAKPHNFALQIKRAPMLAGYGQVALDGKGAALFTRFYEDCKELQDRYDQTEAGPWRMEPKNLEISMNG